MILFHHQLKWIIFKTIDKFEISSKFVPSTEKQIQTDNFYIIEKGLDVRDNEDSANLSQHENQKDHNSALRIIWYIYIQSYRVFFWLYETELGRNQTTKTLNP